MPTRHDMGIVIGVLEQRRFQFVMVRAQLLAVFVLVHVFVLGA